MKKCKSLVLQLCALLMWPVSVWAADPDLPQWHGNDHYKITRLKELVKVDMNKRPWESFSVAMKDLVSAEGLLSLEVKVPKEAVLRIDGFTTDHKQIMLLSENIAPGDFQQLFYDLSAAKAKISYLIFYVNPGKAYKGEVLFKDLQVKSRLAGAEVITIYPNPASSVVNISLPHNGFKQIQVFDPLGKLILTKVPVGAVSRINLSGFAAGSYLVKAKGDNAVLSSRFVVR